MTLFHVLPLRDSWSKEVNFILQHKKVKYLNAFAFLVVLVQGVVNISFQTSIPPSSLAIFKIRNEESEPESKPELVSEILFRLSEWF